MAPEGHADAIDVYAREKTINGTHEYLLMTVPRGLDAVKAVHSGRELLLRERFEDQQPKR
ncbi:hypothetical protein BZM27_12525 [Paraburkholderia steynii]|uniref:Uncharacterized protein n=1 Tax=Paraburkholderia steynii TaxID=1245441 RepID=A0A4R0XDP1_9BURK|nr:hypothetical protein BZM27_12525 [Paraburkholderia steynii]